MEWYQVFTISYHNKNICLCIHYRNKHKRLDTIGISSFNHYKPKPEKGSILSQIEKKVFK